MAILKEIVLLLLIEISFALSEGPPKAGSLILNKPLQLSDFGIETITCGTQFSHIATCRFLTNVTVSGSNGVGINYQFREEYGRKKIIADVESFGEIRFHGTYDGEFQKHLAFLEFHGQGTFMINVYNLKAHIIAEYDERDIIQFRDIRVKMKSDSINVDASNMEYGCPGHRHLHHPVLWHVLNPIFNVYRNLIPELSLTNTGIMEGFNEFFKRTKFSTAFLLKAAEKFRPTQPQSYYYN